MKRLCEQCGEHLAPASGDVCFCDEACRIRWLVAMKKVSRKVALHYVKQRLMGRHAELLYRL
jgi:hypothetical protein